MYLGFEDVLLLIHPAIAVLFVFPLIGIVVWLAWLTRQRRLQLQKSEKTPIPPATGNAHFQVGRWLTGAVVGVELLGISQPMLATIWAEQLWATMLGKLVLIGLLYLATIASLVLLYFARPRVWRATFATLTGLGIILLSFQDIAILHLKDEAIYRRQEELLFSHFYYGVTVALLMVFALAIVPEIYQDRANRWRVVHTVVNCLAIVLFVGQGLTGTRDLLEIPLSWQKPHIYQCDYMHKQCPSPPKQSLQPGVGNG